MTHFNTRTERAVLPEYMGPSQDAAAPAGNESALPRVLAESLEQNLSPGEAARFVFSARAGSVVALGGMDGAAFRELVDQADRVADDRRALFVRLRPAPSVSAHVEQVVALVAEAALRLWPVWFTDVSFAMCGNDTLGRQAAGVIAREAAARAPGVSAVWAEAAARFALAGRPPRVDGVLPAIELAQLSLAISRAGLVLVADASAAAEAPNPAALVHALEWIAQHARAAVIVLFTELPPVDSPFDRILYGARRVVAPAGAELQVGDGRTEASSQTELWLAPWRGTPHPMSEIEQRLAAMLGKDGELAPLFQFNWIVETVRGSKPRVDLVWTDGRLVVELDGYPDHGTPRAFRNDRHRDYELTLSGYTVLRLANDEIVQDYERAIEKIRDLVRLRRSQLNQEG